MKSESGKLIMMFFSVFAFIIAGFEHSIANVGVFSIAYFALGGLPMSDSIQELILCCFRKYNWRPTIRRFISIYKYR